MLLNERNYTQEIKLYSRSQITLLVGSFDPFKGVILDIGDYTPKCDIRFPVSC